MPRHFRNGHVFDGRRHRPDTGVAVEDGRIVAIGTDAEVRERVGGRVEEVDLAGGLLAPGFQDAHVHPMLGGLERLHCDLSGLGTPREYLRAIGEFAAAHPRADWIRGGGWGVGTFPGDGPTAADLDAVVPDRPVFLPSSDHHDAWVNSRALQLAGVDADTPDPPDGWFVRDASGQPTGTVREAAMAAVWERLETSRGDYHEALLEGQRHLHSLGVTGWQDALIGGYAGIDDPAQAYLDVTDAGELTGRVRGALWWDRNRGVEQVADLQEHRALLRRHGVDAGSVKVMMDGVAETFTAAVTEPYAGETGCPCGNRGLAFLSREELFEAMRAVDAAGFQVHVHAIGDRAVHEALDGLEHARRVNGMNDNRHQIAHLQIVRPEDRTRFGELGVAANIQGMWAKADEAAVRLTRPFLDAERVGWQYPFADLARFGAHLAGGSDWPVNEPDPLQAIHVAVNRRGYQPDGPDEPPFLPDQALGLAQAFAAYTSGSAFVNHADDTGRLQIGMRADLTVLDRDPFAGDLDEVAAARVEATYVDGKRVFTRG